MLVKENSQELDSSQLDNEELSEEKINLTLSSGEDIDVQKLLLPVRQDLGQFNDQMTPSGLPNKDFTPEFEVECD